MLLALLCAGCAPHQEPEPATDPPPPAAQTTSDTLLVLGSWSAPVSGWGQEIAVYEDGLVMVQWSEYEETPEPFGRYVQHVAVRRVPPAELDGLRTLVHGDAFGAARSAYHQDGVHDGGSLVVGGQKVTDRRITIVNRPADLPEELRATQVALDALAETTKTQGQPAFAHGPDRVVALWRFTRGDDSKQLTVFASGVLELRTLYTSSMTAHAADDYPTPHAVTGMANSSDLEALVAALDEFDGFGDRRMEVTPDRRTTDTLYFGNEGLEQQLPTNPPPGLVKVLSVLEALESALDG